MLKNLFLIGSFILAFGAFSQEDFDGGIKWGEKITLNRKEIGPDPIGAAGSDFFATKRKKKKTYIQQYNLSSLSLREEHELELEEDGFKLSIVNSFVFGDNAILITKYVDKQNKVQHYFVHEIGDRGSLKDPVDLVELPWMKAKLIVSKKTAEKRASSGAYSFSYIISEDRETMMISYKDAAPVGEKNASNTVLFDKDLNEVSRGSLEIPFDQFAFLYGRLSNTGRYYIAGYEYTEEEISTGIAKLGKRKTRVKGDYHLLVYDAVDGTTEATKFDIGKDITSLGLKVMEDESAIVYGMYSNEDARGISGSFFVSFDPEQNINFNSLEEFEEDFITQFWSPKAKRKAEKKKKKKGKKKQEPSLYRYIMHDMLIKENGNMVLLAEQYYTYTTSYTTTMNGVTTTHYVYHYVYNDIIAVNCSKDGEISWKEKVKKRQHTTNDGGYLSSFFGMTKDDNIYLIYNDKEANMDDADEIVSSRDKRKAKRNTVAAIISIGDEGGITRKTLFDFEGEDSRTLVPKRCEKMSKNEIFVYTRASGRGRYLGWITL